MVQPAASQQPTRRFSCPQRGSYQLRAVASIVSRTRLLKQCSGAATHRLHFQRNVFTLCKVRGMKTSRALIASELKVSRRCLDSAKFGQVSRRFRDGPELAMADDAKPVGFRSKGSPLSRFQSRLNRRQQSLIAKWFGQYRNRTFVECPCSQFITMRGYKNRGNRVIHGSETSQEL